MIFAVAFCKARKFDENCEKKWKDLNTIFIVNHNANTADPHNICVQATMPRLDPDVFDRAAQVAQKSTMLHRHGAIIVRDGEIVSEGYNHHIHYMEHAFSIHAEVDALSKIKHKGRKFLDECTLIVVRIGTKGMGYPLKDSKPCENCQRAIKNHGIRRVFYSA